MSTLCTPHRPVTFVTALCLGLAACSLAACSDSPTERTSALTPAAPSRDAVARPITRIEYNARTPAQYAERWANAYGPLELAAGGTLTVAPNGEATVRAVPFHVGADFSVFDHLKYIAISTRTFNVPAIGSLTFSARLQASTPGTVDGRVVRGCYGPPGSYARVGDPCARPWTGRPLQGQQAGVVLNMVNFQTGQLFDWFVAGDQAFALIERLPSNVTNPSLTPADPGYVGLDKAYTQIIKRQRVTAGTRHDVSIRYTRGLGVSRVEYFLDDALFATVDNVGVPLDVQGYSFTGTYPSLGPGEALGPQLDSFSIGHGLFSLLDAFPFQHPERPDLSVSIPLSERLFGQGAVGTFSNFVVTTQ